VGGESGQSYGEAIDDRQQVMGEACASAKPAILLPKNEGGKRAYWVVKRKKLGCVITQVGTCKARSTKNCSPDIDLGRLHENCK